MRNLLKQNIEVLRVLFHEIDPKSEMCEKLKHDIIKMIAYNGKKLDEINNLKLQKDKVQIKTISTSFAKKDHCINSNFKEMAFNNIQEDVKKHLTGKDINGNLHFSILIGKPL